MVLTREMRDELESAVNNAVHKCLTSDAVIKTIVNNVSEAIMKTMETKLAEMEKSVNTIHDKLSSMKEEYDYKISELKTETEIAKSEKNTLQKKFDQMDQFSRRSNLRILNFEENPSEQIREEVIKVGKKNEGKARGVFIKLHDYMVKHKIYNKKRMLKGTGIIIREDLTGPRMELLGMAVDKYGMRNVWTDSGRIFINKDNKLHKIISKDELMSLL
ncbi:uncharacterized protein LOC123306941 [Coccinella septempunctata]|uniref:uncharacterized protein LOC123306941 n=1 Tax=Coccinella septempunctata TaxID=41139 RepID=UPI001D081CC1|nr:uncharacterized protein LOC123306941 [Coccinella septempunctata]